VLIELIDAKTKEHKETLEVNYILNIFLFLYTGVAIAVLLAMFLLGVQYMHTLIISIIL
jgi:hypothetical protein